MPARLWSLVLAGGAGRRLAAVTGGIPKQFWSGGGSPPLLAQTWARTARLCPPERTVTVVDRSHRPFVDRCATGLPPGRVLYQPQDRGTAAGVRFGLQAILDRDPLALVLLTPADHGIRVARDFRLGVRAAEALVRGRRADVVLFGVEPAGPTSDFGWITFDEGVEAGVWRVTTLVEKPSARRARALFAAGAVWNTMVLVASGEALRALFARHLPDLEAMFAAAAAIDARARDAFLASRYPLLAPADFSRDVLARADNLALLVWPARMGWTDLGTPERLQAWRGRAMAPARVSDVA